MKHDAVRYANEARFGAWGRNGRIRQSGLSATIQGGDIVLEAITSRNVISTAAQLRIPLSDRDAVAAMIKALS